MVSLSSDGPIPHESHRFDCQIPCTRPALDALSYALLKQHALVYDTAYGLYLYSQGRGKVSRNKWDMLSLEQKMGIYIAVEERC